jgi:hypothetical protein
LLGACFLLGLCWLWGLACLCFWFHPVKGSMYQNWRVDGYVRRPSTEWAAIGLLAWFILPLYAILMSFVT